MSLHLPVSRIRDLVIVCTYVTKGRLTLDHDLAFAVHVVISGWETTLLRPADGNNVFICTIRKSAQGPAWQYISRVARSEASSGHIQHSVSV